jgi:hypothetical protein
MQTINTTRLEAQINAITKKIVKGKVRNEYAAKRKIYSLKNQLTELKQYNFYAS